MRRWPIVTRQKISSATADPIDAIADRSLPTTSTITAIAATRSPTCTRPMRRAITGGNWPVDTRWSATPIAG